MPISWPSSSSDDATSCQRRESTPETSINWYIEQEQRHYEDVRTHQLELDQLRLAEFEQPTLVPNQPLNVQEHDEQPQQEWEQEIDSTPICCICGWPAATAVVRNGNDVGRRYLRCQMFPNGCNFSDWIDDPLPPRAVEYALELESEIRILQNQLRELRMEPSQRWF